MASLPRMRGKPIRSLIASMEASQSCISLVGSGIALIQLVGTCIMNFSDWKSAQGAGLVRSVSHSAGVVVWKLFAEKYGERTAFLICTLTTPALARKGTST